MAFFARDTFTGTAGTALVSHTGDPPTNTTWANTVPNYATGDLILTGGSPGGAIAGTADVAIAYASNTPPSADYPVSVDIYFPTVVSGDLVGVVARYLPGSPGLNRYMAFWNAGVWSLYSVAATTVLLGSSSTPAVSAGQTYTLVLTCTGTTITMAVNGTTIATATDSAVTAAGVSGIMTFPTGTPSASVNAILRNFSAGIAPAVNTLTISAPVAYQTLQRSASNQASIAISGTYTGTPTTIEASWNGGAFTTIDPAPAGGAYSGNLANQSPGQGTLAVRWSNDHTVTASVTDIGIGDVFVIAGQSNAAGHGNNNQTYAAPALKATFFGYDYHWKQLLDPAGDSTGSIETGVPWSNACTSPSGSVWPLVATAIMAYTRAPVAFITCAQDGIGLVSSSGIATQYIPLPTDHQDRTTCYGATIYRVLNAGTANGVKGILFWQGETDAQNGVTQASYYAGLQTLIAGFRADLSNAPFLNCKWQNSPGLAPPGPSNEVAIWAAIEQGWATIPGNLPGPDLTDLHADGSGVHVESDANLAVAASRWWDAILRGIYGTSTFLPIGSPIIRGA